MDEIPSIEIIDQDKQTIGVYLPKTACSQWPRASSGVQCWKILCILMSCWMCENMKGHIAYFIKGFYKYVIDYKCHIATQFWSDITIITGERFLSCLDHTDILLASCWLLFSVVWPQNRILPMQRVGFFCVLYVDQLRLIWVSCFSRGGKLTGLEISDKFSRTYLKLTFL